MKLIKFLTTVALTFAFCISAAASQRTDWFFKSGEANSQPEILGGSQMPKEYGALYMGENGDKTVYLTFDAGYGNENLEKILDILKKHNIKGAFFILPGIIKNSPKTVLRMANEGHLVCNHSTTHGDMSKITNIADFEKELLGVEAQYKALTGKDMEKFFRPPQGAFSENTLKFCKELGYTPVFWSFAYADWDNQSQMPPKKATELVLSRAHDGMVMLLHPTSKTNAEILEPVILSLQKKGYSFGTLYDLKNA